MKNGKIRGNYNFDELEFTYLFTFIVQTISNGVIMCYGRDRNLSITQLNKYFIFFLFQQSYSYLTYTLYRHARDFE